MSNVRKKKRRRKKHYSGLRVHSTPTLPHCYHSPSPFPAFPPHLVSWWCKTYYLSVSATRRHVRSPGPSCWEKNTMTTINETPCPARRHFLLPGCRQKKRALASLVGIDEWKQRQAGFASSIRTSSRLTSFLIKTKREIDRGATCILARAKNKLCYYIDGHLSARVLASLLVNLCWFIDLRKSDFVLEGDGVGGGIFHLFHPPKKKKRC